MKSTGGMTRPVPSLQAARSLVEVTAAARAIARERLRCQGVTFVIREGDQCFYADEDSIAPLWAGQRFPLRECISGWAMLHNLPAVVDDIELDDRIPVAAYRSTFVRSLLMVPLRGHDGPAGALGAYWDRTCAAGKADLVWFLSHAAETADRIADIGLADAAWAPTFVRAKEVAVQPQVL